MKPIGKGKTGVLASKYVQNHHPPDGTPPGSKFKAARIVPGGFGVVAARVLQKLLGGWLVLMGRSTPSLATFLQLTAAEGILSKMLPVDGPEAANAMLEGSRIMRVTDGPNYVPTTEESELLCELRPEFIAVGGSMDNNYIAFLAEYAAAMGIWFFWNPNRNSDLRVADVGSKLVLQVSFLECADGDDSPKGLARRLLVQTAAAVVCVTDSARGAVAVERTSPHVFLHGPAIPILEPVRECGAGDAHFAGFLATYLDAPPKIRLERSLHVGRLTSAMHVCGVAPGDWTELARFEAQLDQVPMVAEAA
ncbi:MAG: PfkB family carbohydrate kinase [Gemmataceae bacterium]|nr:PfkB family carbohydrate kinase [Gemmataceae bacterium]MCI0741789.1 PfkB family carbohydrate kinase [Gemmataceae bacterium]